MTWVEQFQVLTFVNLLVCSAAGFICSCRLRYMRFDTTRQSVRLTYAVIVVGLTLNGLWFWFFGGYADWQDVVGSTTALVALLMHSRSWKHGLPDFAKSGPAPLSTDHWRPNRPMPETPVSPSKGSANVDR